MKEPSKEKPDAPEVAEVDRETVEKLLIQVFQHMDKQSATQATLPPDMIYKTLLSSDPQVQSCQLTDQELIGFAAEMIVDENGEVAFVDHVRTWVPIILELRKHKLLANYLQPGAREMLGIEDVDLEDLLGHFHVLPKDMLDALNAPHQASSSRLSRWPSKEKISLDGLRSLQSIEAVGSKEAKAR